MTVHRLVQLAVFRNMRRRFLSQRHSTDQDIAGYGGFSCQYRLCHIPISESENLKRSICPDNSSTKISGFFQYASYEREAKRYLLPAGDCLVLMKKTAKPPCQPDGRKQHLIYFMNE